MIKATFTDGRASCLPHYEENRIFIHILVVHVAYLTQEKSLQRVFEQSSSVEEDVALEPQQNRAPPKLQAGQTLSDQVPG